MSDTLSPFGTFGTGYDVGSYTTPQLDQDFASESKSSPSPLSNPPPETISAPDPIPGFTHKVMASRKVVFTGTCLNTVRYRWSFINSNGVTIGASAQANPIFYFPHAGGTAFYDVKLIVYNTDGDSAQITNRIEVEDLVPVCDFTYVVSGTIVRFTDISTNVNDAPNSWTFGDSEWSIETNPHHTYQGNGVYSVTLRRGSFNRIQTITINAEIILSCDAVTGASGYKWERSANGEDGWVEIDDTVLPSLAVTEAIHGVNPTILNYFRVRAYNSGGDSDYSEATGMRCD